MVSWCRLSLAIQTYVGPLTGGDDICGMQDLTIHNQSTGDTSGACINMGSGNNRYLQQLPLYRSNRLCLYGAVVWIARQ